MNRKEATAAKLTLLQAIAEDGTLAPTDYRLAILLLTRYFNVDYGYAWPSRARLATLLGVDPSTVTRALNRLEARGYFAIRRDKGRGRTNHYYPAFDAVCASYEEKGAPMPPINESEGEAPEKGAPAHIKGRIGAHKRAHGCAPTPFKTPFKNSVSGHASLASPPEGGSRSAPSTPSKQDYLQEEWGSADDMAPLDLSGPMAEALQRVMKARQKRVIAQGEECANV